MPHHSCFKLNKTQPCKSSIYRFLKKYVAFTIFFLFIICLSAVSKWLFSVLTEIQVLVF